MRSFVTAAAMTLGLVVLPTTAAHASGSFQVGVKVSSTTVKLGHRLTFTGHVRPGAAAAGHTVKLQEKYGSAKPWRNVAGDTVGASGRYHLDYKPHTATIREYRVVMPTVGHRARGLSKRLTVKVYDWRLLTKMESVNASGMYPQKDIHINGVKYSDALLARYYYSAKPAAIEFNLNHLCTSIRGEFGISDRSESGSQATVTMEADGTQLYSKLFSLGQGEAQQIALDSPLKIRFTSVSNTTDVTGYGAVGTPEVLCTRAFS